MTRLLAALAALVLIAGCLGEENAQPDEAKAEPELLIDADRPTESFGDIVTGPAVGPDLNATTAAAPKLVEGEWWRVRFDAYLGRDTVEVVRVVANVNDDGYIMGMPHEGWLKEAISFHSPAFGDVNFDLSYNTHNVRFEPVRFPLETGATWKTEFATTPMIATVTSADEFTAEIVLEVDAEAQGSDPVTEALGFFSGAATRLTYDARQHEVVKMESEIGTWEVIEHGYGYEGWVTVPRGEHTAIDYGTFGPVSETHSPAPRTIDVSGGFNRMTMMHFVGTATDAPGYFRIRDIAPDETEFLTEMQGAGFMIKFYESNAPDGTWTVEDVTGGAGFTYSMGIAYHQYDIHLPDGARRSDHSHAVIR